MHSESTLAFRDYKGMTTEYIYNIYMMVLLKPKIMRVNFKSILPEKCLLDANVLSLE